MLISGLVNADATLRVGAEQFERYLPMLEGKRVGLVVNHSALVGDTHLLDALLERTNITTVYSPEHGFRGNADAGEHVEDGELRYDGVEFISLYGERRKPTPELLESVDILVFDMQDVGVRFYTYVSTLKAVMETAGDVGLPVVVLDRPNPLGDIVDGPTLELEHMSFVGALAIPMVHGMTLGELALVMVGEEWLDAAAMPEVTVIEVANYRHDTPYDLPVRPSPNLPNARSIALYPTLGLFESTPVSIGRGTPFPFQVVGYTGEQWGEFVFTPEPSYGAANPKLNGQRLHGDDLRESRWRGINLEYFLAWASAFEESGQVFFDRPDWIDKLTGTSRFREQVMAGASAEEIRASWQQELDIWRELRSRYALYPLEETR